MGVMRFQSRCHPSLTNYEDVECNELRHPPPSYYLCFKDLLSGSSLDNANRKKTLKYWYSWEVKIKKHHRGSIQATIHAPWPLY